MSGGSVLMDYEAQKKMTAILTYLANHKTTGGLAEEQKETLDIAIRSLEVVYGMSASEHMSKTSSADRDILWDAITTNLRPQEPSPEDKVEAERLKNEGNDLMNAEQLPEAVANYTQAIHKDGTSPIYYSNRAAAYIKLNDHQKAIEDCQAALRIDPKYSKAYGRMGIAYTALGNHESAVACHQKALELDPDNSSYRNNLDLVEKTLREASGTRKSSKPEGAVNRAVSFFNNPDTMRKFTRLLIDPRTQQVLSGITSTTSSDRLSNLLQAGQLLLDHFSDN